MFFEYATQVQETIPSESVFLAPQTESEPRIKYLIGKTVPFSNILFEFIQKCQQLFLQKLFGR